ncbi:F-box/LRR-repeat protein At3g62440 isoform X2 [Brassica rapa]|uniref:F-box/LRR-repeat protein At3g62440 isoform X2 n=1 Tax=Brassica campestris TaxID=3711 RepID=UPI0004F17410|nr:F-box/LRR-repeat protein At3g62440 isoform X2 [Brassica rapa]
MDRISDLPDEILHHIGSFLSAKEAAFATLLSKRWRSLFTIIPNLHFSGSLTRAAGGRFKDFADRVLALPVSSRVRTFSLKCKHVARYEDLINRCLRHVLNRGVLVLELHIKVPRKRHCYYSLPCDVLTCKTVSTMKLGPGFVIEALPADVFLPALKSLVLDSVRFFAFDGRCSFNTLLSQSPVLEELVMDGIEFERWKWCSTVSSTTLKRLTIRRREWFSYDETDEENIRVDSRCLTHEFDNVSFHTPALTYLEYSDYVPKEYLTVNLDSLVEANLNLWVDEEGVWRPYHATTFNPMTLINGLKHVAILSLTSEAVEMFDVLNESIPMFVMVSQLSLGLSEGCWFSLTNVIKKFPNLKTLIIESILAYCLLRWRS